MTYRLLRKDTKVVIVDFSSECTGIAIINEADPRIIGMVITDWVPHSDTSSWEPCADPRPSKKQKLMAILKDL